jgi:DNA-binding IscR family transcriptional regulator
MTATLWLDTARDETVELGGTVQMYEAFAEMARAGEPDDYPDLFGVPTAVELQGDAPPDWLADVRRQAAAFLAAHGAGLSAHAVTVLRALAPPSRAAFAAEDLMLHHLDFSGLDPDEFLSVLFDAALQGAPEDLEAEAAEFYSEDQPRVPAGQPGGGQWTSGAAPGEREAARQAIRDIAGGKTAPSADHAHTIARHLATLTVKQIRELQKEFGIKGSVPTKAVLVEGVAHQIALMRAAHEAAGRGEAGPPAPVPVAEKPRHEMTAPEAVKAGLSHGEWSHAVSRAFVNEAINEDHPAYRSLRVAGIDDYREAGDLFGREVRTSQGRYGTVVDFPADLSHAVVRHPDGTHSKQVMPYLHDVFAEIRADAREGKAPKASDVRHAATVLARQVVHGGGNVFDVISAAVGVPGVKARELARAVIKEVDRIKGGAGAPGQAPAPAAREAFMREKRPHLAALVRDHPTPEAAIEAGVASGRLRTEAHVRERYEMGLTRSPEDVERKLIREAYEKGGTTPVADASRGGVRTSPVAPRAAMTTPASPAPTPAGLETALAGGQFRSIKDLAKATGLSGNAVSDRLAALRDEGRLEYGMAGKAPGYRLLAAPAAPPAAAGAGGLTTRAAGSLRSWHDASLPLGERVARLADVDTDVLDALARAGHLNQRNGFPGNNELLRSLQAVTERHARGEADRDYHGRVVGAVERQIPQYAAALRGLADRGVSVRNYTDETIGPPQLRAFADTYEREGMDAVRQVRQAVTGSPASAPPASDTATLARAYLAHPRAASGSVSLADLHESTGLPVDRLHAAANSLRSQGLVSASRPEGGGGAGVTPREQAAMIREHGEALLYLSARDRGALERHARGG